jgi:hypothetical protein
MQVRFFPYNSGSISSPLPAVTGAKSGRKLYAKTPDFLRGDTGQPNMTKLHLVVIAMASAVTVLAGENVPVRVEQTAGESVRMVHGAQTIWQFNYAAKLNKPFFHPLAVPDGPVLTWNEPPDHPWHHGCWFSWKLINGVNYWENDQKTGRPIGRTTWSDVHIEPLSGQAVRISMSLAYKPPDSNESVLTEQRAITVSVPDNEGVYMIDWASQWTARADEVHLDRTPLPHEPGGKNFGGYAGLSVRFAEGMTDRRARSVDAELPFVQGRYRGKHRAVEYHGELNGTVVGIALIDHPANKPTPSPWYLIQANPMSYANAAVICYEPLTLKKGEQRTLRYRLLVHPGRWTAEQLRAAIDQFARTPIIPFHE